MVKPLKTQFNLNLNGFLRHATQKIFLKELSECCCHQSFCHQ